MKNIILVLCVLAGVSMIKACHDQGDLKVFEDPSCDRGGVGCNAGGQGQRCRFCGFGPMVPCPNGGGSVVQPPQPERPQPPITDQKPHSNSDVKFRTINNCPYPVWVGIQGRTLSNANYKPPNKGGWKLESGQSNTIYVPYDFSAARIWPRTGCKTVNGQFHCDTGDCGPWVQCAHDGIQRGGAPPVSLAEFTLAQDQDYYDVSLVDGFNIPIAIRPIDRQKDPNQFYVCNSPTCTRDLNQICPSELQKRNSEGRVVACRSACQKFGTDEYCCHGAHDRPETCKSSNWPVNYPSIFKQACPMAYSYAYDDHSSTFFCDNTGYDVVFC